MDSLHAVPDDVVSLILLRLDSQISLLRAASTCKRWRRIIAGTVFLRRFRSLHEPPITGSYYNNSVSLPPRFEPSSSSPVTNSRYIPFDFLLNNTTCHLTIKDSQGSLLLLDRYDEQLSDLIICEPLTRNYDAIPPWTAPAVYRYREHFLLDGNSADAAGGISMSDFRVLCIAHGESIVHAGVFTAAGRTWRQIRIDQENMHFIGRAADSLFWHCKGWTVATLNQSTAAAEFSSFELPSANCDPYDPTSIFSITVTTGGDGDARIVVSENGRILKVYARMQGDGSEWTPEKSIQLSAPMFGHQLLERWFLQGPDRGAHGRGKVLLVLYYGEWKYGGRRKFGLNIDTLEVEHLLDAEAYPTKLPWPPSLQSLH